MDLTSAVWRKSSYSGDSGNCVETATNLPGKVLVRDSKDPSAVLEFTADEWQAFIRGAAGGEFEPS